MADEKKVICLNPKRFNENPQRYSEQELKRNIMRDERERERDETRDYFKQDFSNRAHA